MFYQMIIAQLVGKFRIFDYIAIITILLLGKNFPGEARSINLIYLFTFCSPKCLRNAGLEQMSMIGFWYFVYFTCEIK